jgi:hypothetical protein
LNYFPELLIQTSPQTARVGDVELVQSLAPAHDAPALDEPGRLIRALADRAPTGGCPMEVTCWSCPGLVIAGKEAAEPCSPLSYAWAMLTARSWRSTLEAALPIGYGGASLQP